MKKNLEILEIEPKLTKKEDKYWRIKTSEGWMSCFDSIASAKVKEFLGGIACVEVVTSGDFSNIKKCYGPSEEVSESAPGDKVETVRPGERKSVKGSAYEKDPTGLAVEIYCNSIKAMKDFNSETLMAEAIDAVKQAKKAFE
jgi:hypothetical protein